MTIKFLSLEHAAAPPPAGKLAECELHFSDGPLAGLKLIGFAVWQNARGGRNVTFPARQYSINGDKRSFALLRPRLDDMGAQERIRLIILDAYATWEADESQPDEVQANLEGPWAAAAPPVRKAVARG